MSPAPRAPAAWVRSAEVTAASSVVPASAAGTSVPASAVISGRRRRRRRRGRGRRGRGRRRSLVGGCAGRGRAPSRATRGGRGLRRWRGGWGGPLHGGRDVHQAALPGLRRLARSRADRGQAAEEPSALLLLLAGLVAPRDQRPVHPTPVRRTCAAG